MPHIIQTRQIESMCILCMQWIILASPPCEVYSRANTTGRVNEETLREADVLVECVFLFEQHLKSIATVIENPATGRLVHRKVNTDQIQNKHNPSTTNHHEHVHVFVRLSICDTHPNPTHFSAGHEQVYSPDMYRLLCIWWLQQEANYAFLIFRPD